MQRRRVPVQNKYRISRPPRAPHAVFKQPTACACACVCMCVHKLLPSRMAGIGSDRKLYGLVSEAVFFYREPIRPADILLLVVLIKKNRSIGECGKGCRASSLL